MCPSYRVGCLPPDPRAGYTAAPADLLSSFRLSPVSHGNTIALFFRSLLPNYTMEVCEHVLASLCHVGSGRAVGLCTSRGFTGASSQPAQEAGTCPPETVAATLAPQLSVAP